MPFDSHEQDDTTQRLALPAPVLHRLAGTELIARGSVNVISVKAIRSWAGDWWSQKRGDVWTYVERKLAEHLDRSDMRARISDSEFLIAMNSDQGLAAQATSVKILEDVLTHLLGSVDINDLGISSVIGVENGEAVCRRIDAASVLASRARRDSQRSPVRRAVEAADEARRTPVAFTTAGGAALRVDFTLEHVVSLRRNVATAIRIEPVVTHLGSGRQATSRAVSRLPDRDIAFVDEATLKFAALFARGAQGHDTPDLILPASFRTLGTQRGRDMLTGTPGLSLALLRGGVMIELVDITRGTPSGRLLEVVGLLKALTRGVIARVPPEKDALRGLKDARLAGLALDASDLTGPAEKVAAEIMNFGRDTKGLAPMTILQGLPAEGYFAAAETAGLTHAALRATNPLAAVAAAASAKTAVA
jgi:GGDEF domain-containing protein